MIATMSRRIQPQLLSLGIGCFSNQIQQATMKTTTDMMMPMMIPAISFAIIIPPIRFGRILPCDHTFCKCAVTGQ